MILLSVQSLTKHYGPEPVLADLSFDVRPGERIGLVGPNGAGKTTLIRIIAGREEADAGTVGLHGSTQLGYLEQQPSFAPGHTVWDEARGALAHLVDLADRAQQAAEALAQAEDEAQRKRLGRRLDDLQNELHHRDAYELDHKIERVLHGLGFTDETFAQPVDSLSGGQQNRLLLACLLLVEPDLMLLDEPSNHLDIESTEWLENHLVQVRGSLIVVSHDRYFLDKVTNRTLELFRGTVDDYRGNFSAYWLQKAERLEVERRTYERQQLEIAKLKDFIRRNRYGQKHAQAEDRRKKLERIEPVDPPREIAAPVMGFPPASRTGDIVLRVEHLAKSFAASLFSDLTFEIARGQKWGILGPNGSGKTTLLRCILGQIPPDDGRIVLGTGAVTGYFDQSLTSLDADAMVVDAIRPAHKEFIESQRRKLLARFGLTDEMVFQKVSSLSGGEQNRAALARLVAAQPNFLLLDEPTNHLDLWALDSLERSLKEFAGSVLLVSHDRYFLNRLVDHLLVIEPGHMRVIEGNYDMYVHLTQAGSAGKSNSNDKQAPSAKKAPPSQKRKRTDKKKPRKRQRQFPYRKVEDLEAEIFLLETRTSELHEQLASPDVLRDGERIKALKEELTQHEQNLAKLYKHWEEATELN